MNPKTGAPSFYKTGFAARACVNSGFCLCWSLVFPTSFMQHPLVFRSTYILKLYLARYVCLLIVRSPSRQAPFLSFLKLHKNVSLTYVHLYVRAYVRTSPPAPKLTFFSRSSIGGRVP